MKNVLILFGLAICLSTAAQKNKESFAVLVLQPDTAVLEGSLLSEIKTVEQDQQDRYISAISQMESVMNTSYPKEAEKQMSRTREEIKKSLQEIREKKSAAFKYYHVLSSQLTEECIRYFAQNPSIHFSEYETASPDLSKLNDLSNKMNCDYIVYFSDITGKENGSSPVLKVTTSVYSKKDNAIVFSQPAEVCCDNKGNGALSSLLRDAAVSSFDKIIAVLKEKS